MIIQLGVAYPMVIIQLGMGGARLRPAALARAVWAAPGASAGPGAEPTRALGPSARHQGLTGGNV